MAGSRDGKERRDKRDHYRRAALRHPLRRRILQLLFDGSEAGAAEIATELGEALGRISHHLRVLVKRDALRAVARGRPMPALYRWSPQAQWARKMLRKNGA